MSDTARELVRQLEGAGGWPDPALYDAIVAEGEAAVEPLLDVVRRDLVTREESPALYDVVRLLRIVGARPAISALLALYRTFDEDILDNAALTLATCGAEVIEPLLAVAADRSLGWYPRSIAVWGARMAAGDDLAGRQRIAEVVRDVLAECLARKDDVDDDLIELTSSVVNDLAELADPLARDLIEQAFQAGLVDESLIDREEVQRLYEQGGEPQELPDPKGWLEHYRQDYAERQAWEQRSDEDYASFPVRTYDPEEFAEDEDEEPEPPPIEPIRYTRSRPGRNDPCWCGSGKKYKKCHLSQDQETSRDVE